MDNQKINQLVRELRIELVKDLPRGIGVKDYTPYQKKVFATAKLCDVIDCLNDNGVMIALEKISQIINLILNLGH